MTKPQDTPKSPADETAGVAAPEGPETSPASGARTKRGKRHPRARAIVAWAGLAIVVIGVAAVGMAGYGAYANRSVASRLAVSEYEADRLAKTLDPLPSTITTEPMYILLVGDDRRSEARARSDALILARIDPVRKSAIMLSIARDTRVAIPGRGVSKINAAYSWGGPALAVQTVKDFTGLPVNHYVAVDFEGLTEVVDVLGGLWIDVDREIDDEYRKKDPGPGGVSHIDKGYQKLNGGQALTYVRSRWFPESDWLRCVHQRAFLKALAKQTQAASPTTQMLVVAIASKNLKSDMTVSQLVDVARAMKGTRDEDIIGRTVPGKDQKVNGIWFILPDEAKTRALTDYMSRGEVPPGSEKWGLQ